MSGWSVCAILLRMFRWFIKYHPCLQLIGCCEFIWGYNPHVPNLIVLLYFVVPMMEFMAFIISLKLGRVHTN